MIASLRIVALILLASQAKAFGIGPAPAHIQHVLDSLYPNHSEIVWVAKHRKYTADFVYDSFSVSITFGKDGTVKNHVREITFDRLPEKVQAKVHENYASFKILMVTMTDKKGKIEYDVEVIRGRHHLLLNYQPSGYLKNQYTLERYDWTAAVM